MAVPSPSVALALVPGGTNFARFQGDVGVAGASQNLNIDLTAFPEVIRRDPFFKDQIAITFKSLDDNITFAGPADIGDGAFFSPSTINEYVQIQVTSDLTTRQCLIIVEHRHTVGR